MYPLKLMVAATGMAALFSCGQQQKPVTTGDVSTESNVPVEHVNTTPEQQERRAASEKICADYNIPVYKNQHAMFLDPADSVTIRTKDAVVDRLLALCLMELKSEDPEQAVLDGFIKRYNVMPKLSPKERAFIGKQQPEQQEMIDANWRAEGTHVMLWALGFVDSLAYPATACSVEDDVKIIFANTEQELRNKAKLRSKKEILDQADLILRFDWASVNAKIKNEDAPGSLNSSVVVERHYALNWLITYLNQDWDDVTPNT